MRRARPNVKILKRQVDFQKLYGLTWGYMGLMDAARTWVSQIGNKPPEEERGLQQTQKKGTGFSPDDRSDLLGSGYGTFRKTAVQLPEPMGTEFNAELNKVVASQNKPIKKGDTLNATDKTVLLNHKVTQVFTNSQGDTVAYGLERNTGVDYRVPNVLLHTSDRTQIDDRAMKEISAWKPGKETPKSVALEPK